MESQHYIKRTRRRKFSVSPRLAQLTKEFLDGGGKFGFIPLNILFTSSNGDTDIQKSHINGRGELVISSGVENQGVIGKSDIHARIFFPNTITIDMFGNVFMRDFAYKMVTHARVFSLSPILPIERDCLVYLSTSLKYFSQIYSYSNMASWDKVKSKSIYCPISPNGEIAFDFMRRYIATLKAERVATLKAYLQAAGLSNTILTEDERAALDALRQNRVEWREIPICGKDGAFNVSNTHCVLKAQIVPGSGNIPYVGAGESNNSIQSYISYSPDFIERGNSIMIGGKTLVITYQEEDYISNDSHNLALYYKDIENPNRNLQLFLVSALYRSLKPKYHWGDSISKSKIKNDTLMLPTKDNGAIDYDFINGLISAQIKLCINDVLNAKDLEISTTEQIIESDTDTVAFEEYSYPSMAAEPYEVYQRCDFTETVLIGCYRDKKHLKWILANHIYNIRMGKRKGSVEDKPECFGRASRLYLYDLKHTDKVSVFSIVDHKEMLATEMKEMGYPKKSPSKSYMTFKIEEIDNNKDVYNLNITEILAGLENHVNGEPVFIEPEKE